MGMVSEIRDNVGSIPHRSQWGQMLKLRYSVCAGSSTWVATMHFERKRTCCCDTQGGSASKGWVDRVSNWIY